MHAYHESLPNFDPRDVLHDGCEECEQRAAKGLDGILSLDAGNQHRLWLGMLAHEWGSGLGRAVSAADHRAMRTLYLVAVFMERCGIRPDEIEQRMAAEHERVRARVAALTGNQEAGRGDR